MNVSATSYDDPIPYIITELGAQILEETTRSPMGDRPQEKEN